MSYFVYILQSEKDQGYYIGFTQDLTKRLRGHNLGINHATKSRRPFNLVYFEKFENKTDALKRENQIKKYKGGRALKKLLKL